MTFQHIPPDDLALFALQFLPAEEMAVLRAHLERCSECRAELAEIQGDLAAYALTAEPHTPPAAARDRLLTQIAREPRPRPLPAYAEESAPPQASAEASATAPGRPRAQISGASAPSILLGGTPRGGSESNTEDAPRFGSDSRPAGPHLVARTLPWIGWAVAATLGVVLAQSYHERDTLRNDVVSVNHQIAQLTAQTLEARRVLETLRDPSAERVTLTLSKQRPVPQGKATYVPEKGALVFLANNLEPLAPLKTYELWVIPSNGDSPIAAGIFHPDEHGNASVILPKLPAGVVAKAFGVTVEDEGGSLTPTMPILLAGAASS